MLNLRVVLYAAICNTKLHKRFTTNYRPQQYLRKGNVFPNSCQEFCPQEGSASGSGGMSASRSDRGDMSRQTPSPGRHSIGRRPQAEAPLPERPLQQTVRILLKCILVNIYCRGITWIHRSPSRPRPSMRLTAAFINIHEHLI